MNKSIMIQENGLSVSFHIREDGVVELNGFHPVQDNVKTKVQEDPEIVSPLLEVQVTGKSTRAMHAYKHNFSSAS